MAECTCPSWWDCIARGCYEDAKARYADVSIKRDLARGYASPQPYEQEFDSFGEVMPSNLPKRKHQ